MEGNLREPPRHAPQEGPPFAQRNYTESVQPDRSLDNPPDLHVSVPNAVPSAQIRDNPTIQSKVTALGTSSVALNVASTSRNIHSLNAADDTEHASTTEHVENAHESLYAQVDQRTDSRMETGPSSG